jgi:thymidylate kinase
MIVALEGPDCCGKTTLFRALAGRLPEAVFVPSLPQSKELFAVMPAVEARQLALWDCLYDPSKLYVCDRHVAVSALVYDALFCRQAPPIADQWFREVRPVYLGVPLDELERRFAGRGDEYVDASMLARTLLLYSEVLKKFRCLRLDGTLPTSMLADLLCAYCRRM